MVNGKINSPSKYMLEKGKIQKLALKMLILCPVGYLIALLILDMFGHELNPTTYALAFIGVVLGALFIVLNASNYSKFPNLSNEDFLECEHRCSFRSNQQETLDKLDKIMQLQFDSAVLTDKQDEHGYRMYRINSKFRNAYLHIKFSGDQFELNIKPDFLSFVPDSARNYTFLSKLREELN